MKLRDLARVGSGVARYYALRRRTPLIVSFLVTYRCNQHCLYCDSDTQAGDEITTDQAIAILRDMRRLGTFKVGFTGGECLVREDIDELLAVADDLGLVVSVSTNGLVAVDHVAAIKRHVDLLQVSIDGPREVHDAMRGEGSYAAAIEAVRAATGAGVRTVVNTVLTELTVETMPHMVRLARELGVSLLFQPVFTYILSAPGPAIDAFRPRAERLADTVRDLIERKKRGEPVGNSHYFLRYLLSSWPDGGSFRCLAGQLFCAVDPTGRVMPCCFLAPAREWPGSVELGVDEAFRLGSGTREVAECAGCYCNAYIESSAIFSLNPGAVANALAVTSQDREVRRP